MKYLSVFLLISLAVICSADTLIDDFQVNSNFPGHPPQKSPYAVANWDTETIHLTWLSQHDGEHWDVAFNRFDYDLEPLGDATYLNIRTDDADCRQPRLVLSDNGFGAAWIEEDTPNRLRFRSFDASGTPLCNPINIIDNGLNVTRDSLNIAALDDGYLLVWYDERDSSKVWARKVGFDGTLVGFNFPIRPDSTGSILGLEAQNHPDGRVLVSWVVDGMYSRGRWLDADGEFLGDVFEMSDPFEEDEIIRSALYFSQTGTGLIQQYSQIEVGIGGPGTGKLSYLTQITEQAIQSGEQIEDFFWDYSWDEGRYYGEGYSAFPDLIYFEDTSRIRIKYEYSNSGGGSSPNNISLLDKIYSSICGSSIIPYGLIDDDKQYYLCQIDSNNFIYAFSLSVIGMRKYDIATLDSSASIQWVYEPGFYLDHSFSDLCVHSDGSFRVIYNNKVGVENNVFTRYFNSQGLPTDDDFLVSQDQSQIPVFTNLGEVEKTSADQALVLWQYNGDYWGTYFTGDTWSGIVQSFGCGYTVHASSLPKASINSEDKVVLSWKRVWWGGWWSTNSHQIYTQVFDLTFNPFTSAVATSTEAYHGFQLYGYDVALQSNGNFVLCWLTDNEGSNPFYIRASRGENYDQLVETNYAISSGSNGDYCSTPVVSSSQNGFLMTWIQGNSAQPDNYEVFLCQLDIDGSINVEAMAVSDSLAVPINTPDLAVSETGNFAVCWQDARFDEGDIFCRQFNPDGSFYGYEYRVNSDPVGPLQKEPAVAFGPNDQLYFTWTDFRDPDHNGDIYCKVIEWEDAIGVESEKELVPLTFALHLPYPNPFNPTTTISFDLPVASVVSLVVYNIQGCAVVKLVEGKQMAGAHQVSFYGTDLASGIYFVRLKAGDYTGIQKLVLLK